MQANRTCNLYCAYRKNKLVLKKNENTAVEVLLLSKKAVCTALNSIYETYPLLDASSHITE